MGTTNDDSGDTARLMAIAYEELRGLAGAYLAQQSPGHTLQPTALVHEAYLKLERRSDVAWASREHFLAVSAMAMRSVLADHARTKGAYKRGGGRRPQTLVTGAVPVADRDVDVVALEDALEKLERLDERQARVVAFRFFAGMTIAEVAGELGVSERTVSDDWTMARAWLSAELADGAAR